MFVQLIDKDGFKSPVLYIHADEKEFMEQINIWRQQVQGVINNYSQMGGLPLGRLNPATCMVDLIRHLGNYYVESTPLSFLPTGHVYGCLSIENEENLSKSDVITIINLHEEG